GNSRCGVQEQAHGLMPEPEYGRNRPIDEVKHGLVSLLSWGIAAVYVSASAQVTRASSATRNPGRDRCGGPDPSPRDATERIARCAEAPATVRGWRRNGGRLQARRPSRSVRTGTSRSPWRAKCAA